MATKFCYGFQNFVDYILNQSEPLKSSWTIKKKDLVNGNDVSCGQDEWNSKKETFKKCCVSRNYDVETGTTTKVSKMADDIKE